MVMPILGKRKGDDRRCPPNSMKKLEGNASRRKLQEKVFVKL